MSNHQKGLVAILTIICALFGYLKYSNTEHILIKPSVPDSLLNELLNQNERHVEHGRVLKGTEIEIDAKISDGIKGQSDFLTGQQVNSTEAIKHVDEPKEYDHTLVNTFYKSMLN